MKMELAVYTAQDGYSWQPGTALTAEELAQFKKCIGKFPSPDAADFPFGGVFLLDNRVVFYRYHVAKKIDFCGRDALYCVLGAVPRAEAAKIDPVTLFALPEFAGPMQPFPTTIEVPTADAASVPEWLGNLDRMTLDVRISGPADKPVYAVVQNPADDPCLADDFIDLPPSDDDTNDDRPLPAVPVASRQQEVPRRRRVWLTVMLTAVAFLLAFLSVLLFLKLRTVRSAQAPTVNPVAVTNDLPQKG